jgi:putative restriction endonuclease
LGQLQADKPRFISYEVTREKLTELLRESALSGSPITLKNLLYLGSLHSLLYPEAIPRLSSNRNRQLLADGVAGGFTPEVYQLLKNDLRLVQEIAHIVLDSHFPETIH